MRNILFIFLFCCSSCTFATLPQSHLFPGGIAVFELEATEKPQVFFNQNRAAVIKNNHKWITVLGLPLNASPGLHTYKVISNNIETIHKFNIVDQKYDIEHITISDPNKVTPRSTTDQKRILQELAQIKKLFNNFDDERELDDLSFILPTTGRKSSPFGLKRILNGEPKAAHSGLDLAAVINTPVYASKDGIITKASEFFFNGNTVFIDHGQGVVSNYCHLNNILVKENQFVKRGELIGTVGKTGRATGPHLHWSISLNNVRVDPELFFK